MRQIIPEPEKSNSLSMIDRRTKIHSLIVILMCSALIIGSILYLNSAINLVNFEINFPSQGTAYYQYSNSSQNMLLNGNISCRFDPPKERTIILRMDDAQGYAWSQAVMTLTDAVINKNMSITLAVIPTEDLARDTTIKNYLVNRVKNPRIEIAQHGVTHVKNEFLNLNESEAYTLANRGLERLIKVLHVRPITFIPPDNEYNEDTIKAISRLGFIMFSAKQYEYRFDGNIIYLGYTSDVWGSTDLVPIEEIINDCRASLESKNICVVMIHPQNYIGKDNITLNESRFKKFIELLDGLNSLNAKSATFKDLIRCR